MICNNPPDIRLKLKHYIIMMKPKRIENKQLLQSYHSKRCLVCHKPGADPCHIRSIGAGGDDSEDNLMALCRRCHTEQHSIGIGTFALKYSIVESYLNSKGWEIVTFGGVNKVVKTWKKTK